MYICVWTRYHLLNQGDWIFEKSPYTERILSPILFVVAKSNDPDQRKQAQKLQSYYQLYGSSLEGDVTQTVVSVGDMAKYTNAAVKKTKKSQVSYLSSP